MSRADAINQVKELSAEWEMSFEETVRDVIIDFYVAAGFYEEQIVNELAPMGEAELMEAFFNTFCVGSR